MSDRLPAVANCSRCNMLKYACYTHAHSSAPVEPTNRPSQSSSHPSNNRGSRSGSYQPPPQVKKAPPPPVDDEDEFPELGSSK